VPVRLNSTTVLLLILMLIEVLETWVHNPLRSGGSLILIDRTWPVRHLPIRDISRIASPSVMVIPCGKLLPHPLADRRLNRLSHWVWVLTIIQPVIRASLGPPLVVAISPIKTGQMGTAEREMTGLGLGALSSWTNCRENDKDPRSGTWKMGWKSPPKGKCQRQIYMGVPAKGNPTF